MIRHEKYGTPADVYSFGILAWETFTHGIPFDGTYLFYIFLHLSSRQTKALGWAEGGVLAKMPKKWHLV